jgi:hypothetical protein
MPAANVKQTVPEQLGSRIFENAGIVTCFSDDRQLIVDCGPFGAGSAGHSHSDGLSILVRKSKSEVLIDPATYTYVGDAQWRNRFRGSAAHNTIRIDGMDQAQPATPFSWIQPSAVRLLEFTRGEADTIDGEWRDEPFWHRRRIRFVKPDLIVVLDQAGGPSGEHTVEQFWHPRGEAALVSPHSVVLGGEALLTVDRRNAAEVSECGEFGWRSPVFAVKVPASVVRVCRKAALPVQMAAVIDLSGDLSPATVEFDGGAVSYRGVKVATFSEQ